MNSIERFLNTAERKPVDYPASWLGIPDAKAYEGLFAYFQVNSIAELKEKIADDLYDIEMPYHSPEADAIYTALQFTRENMGSENRTLTAPGFFADMEEVSEVNNFVWPDPAAHIDPQACEDLVNSVPAGKAALGILWSSHFQDACAAFGMEEAFVKMLTEPELYKAVDDKIVNFYLKANEIFYKATKGRLHAVLIGNDVGSQNGLMLSADMIREFVLPGAKKLINQAKEYGLKVIYHSCGAVSEAIPLLIEAGVDIIHPIQALAKGMDAESLKSRFGNQVGFCGGVDAQQLLVNGHPEEVAGEVCRLKEIFPTGLIFSPSHEAILQDTKPENIAALFSMLHRPE